MLYLHDDSDDAESHDDPDDAESLPAYLFLSVHLPSIIFLHSTRMAGPVGFACCQMSRVEPPAEKKIYTIRRGYKGIVHPTGRRCSASGPPQRLLRVPGASNLWLCSQSLGISTSSLVNSKVARRPSPQEALHTAPHVMTARGFWLLARRQVRCFASAWAALHPNAQNYPEAVLQKQTKDGTKQWCFERFTKEGALLPLSP